MGIDKDLLAILACPLCKTAVREEGERLICDQCGRRYPVRDGIPVMLIDEAELPASAGEVVPPKPGEAKPRGDATGSEQSLPVV